LPGRRERFTFRGRPPQAGPQRAHYYRQDLGQYDNGSATSYILPLAFDMVPPADRTARDGRLVDKIVNENHGHGSHGLVGGQWVNRVLTPYGHGDVAYAMATQTTYPSLGYMAARGATTVWELWNGDTADPSMNSGNHVMLVGDLVTWLYEECRGNRPRPGPAGIPPHPDAPDAGRRPEVGQGQLPLPLRADRERVEARRRGLVLARGDRPGQRPATVYVPAAEAAAAVTESAAPAAQAEGVQFLRSEAGAAVYEVGSGPITSGRAQSAEPAANHLPRKPPPRSPSASASSTCPTGPAPGVYEDTPGRPASPCCSSGSPRLSMSTTRSSRTSSR
jgi:alpha-L-rhamnosidase